MKSRNLFRMAAFEIEITEMSYLRVLQKGRPSEKQNSGWRSIPNDAGLDAFAADVTVWAPRLQDRTEQVDKVNWVWACDEQHVASSLACSLVFVCPFVLPLESVGRWVDGLVCLRRKRRKIIYYRTGREDNKRLVCLLQNTEIGNMKHEERKKGAGSNEERN